MKHRLQTFLRHKLQWLVLLTALLGVSQGVWGYDMSGNVYFANTSAWSGVNIRFYDGGWGTKGDIAMSRIANTGIYQYCSGYNSYHAFQFFYGSNYDNGSKQKSVSGNKWFQQSSDSNDSGNGTLTQLNGTAKVISKVSENGANYTNTSSSYCVATISSINLPSGWITTQTTSGSTGSSTYTATCYPAYGATITYTASATGKYEFKGFSATSSTSLPGSLKSSGYTETATELGTDHTTYYAYFATKSYSVSAGVVGSTGGTASVSSSTVYHGSNATFTATPSSGYAFVGWFANSSGSGSAESTSSSYEVAITSAKTLYAKFAASCTKPDAVAISGTSTLTFANNSETVQTTLTATGTGDSSHDIYTYGWTTPTVMTGTAPLYSSTSAYNPTITFYREGTYTVRASAKCTGGTATTQDKTVTIKPGRLYISGPLYNGTWAITDYMTRSVSGSTITYTKEWSANLSASGETNHFTVSRITTQNHASTIVNAYAYLATKTGISENGGTNNNLYPSFDVTEGDGLRLTVVYKGEVYGSGSSRQPKYYYTLEKTCSAVSKSQYTMATQSKQWTGSPITPDITKDNNAGTIKNYYYSTDGSTWTSGLPTALGTYSIKIDVNAGSTYCAKDGIILDNTLTITRKSRTISIDNTDVVCGAGTYTLSSTASVGSGTKTYSISGTSSIASISGTTLTLTGAGTFTVQVNIAASGNYEAASGTKEFTVTLPTLSTSAATSISYTSATLNGSVSNVTCTPSASGFEYKKGSDAYTSVAAASATGSISKEISGLTPGTTYTFRTYTVVNGVTKYSSTRTFTTTSCSAPVISSSSLSAQSKCKDASGTAMSVTASGGVGTLTYTWYKKNDTTPSGGTQVQSSTSNSYTPPTGTVGTLYYYCVVSSASPCASSTVNSGISGAVEILQKPVLTLSPTSGFKPYQPVTVTSNMAVDASLPNAGWGASANSTTQYYVSKGSTTAVYKNGSTSSSAFLWAVGTNGCSSSNVTITTTADTETCP